MYLGAQSTSGDTGSLRIEKHRVGRSVFTEFVLLLQMAGDKSDTIATIIEEAGGWYSKCKRKKAALSLRDFKENSVSKKRAKNNWRTASRCHGRFARDLAFVVSYFWREGLEIETLFPRKRRLFHLRGLRFIFNPQVSCVILVIKPKYTRKYIGITSPKHLVCWHALHLGPVF